MTIMMEFAFGTQLASLLGKLMHHLPSTALILLTAMSCLGTANAQGLLAPTPQFQQSDPFLGRDTWAVLVDDWNNDGKADLFFANSDPGNPVASSRLLFGNGGWLFEAIEFAPATAAATADLDGDGDRDLVLVSAGAVRIYQNLGYGSFSPTTLSAYQAPSCLALGDIDGDGDQDLIVGHQSNQQNRLYRNNGNGTFTEGTQGGLPFFNDATTAVRLVDVDGDGDLDLITGNNQQPTRLALNTGAGVFLDATGTHMPAITTSVNAIEAGDVDGDGDPDLVVGATYVSPSSTNLLLINDGTGHFTDQTAARLPAWTGVGVALVDVDIDQDLDLVVPAWLSPTQVFRNDGTGHFANDTAALLPNFTRAGRAIAVGDLDGDLRRDVVIGCEALGYSAEPLGREVLLQNMPTGLLERIPPVHEPWGGMLPAALPHINALVLIDHDHDGDLDLFAGSDWGQQDRLYENDGKGVFTDVTATRLPPEWGNTVEVAAGDVNGDSYDDLVLTWYDGQTRLWLGSGSGGFTDATAARMPALTMRAIAVALGDIDGDGDKDIVLGADGQSRVFTNNGQGYFTDWTQFALMPMGTIVNAVQLVDLDNDGDLDLLMADWGFSMLLRFTNNGTGVFTLTGNPGLNRGRMVAADFDGDGDKDIFCTFGHTTIGSWRLLRNNGGGSFTIGAFVSPASGNESTLTAVDIDSDGDLDVVATSLPMDSLWGTNRVFVNDGTGSFTSVEFPGVSGVREFSRAAAVGDVDGDGDPDVLVGNRAGTYGAQVFSGEVRLFVNATRHVVANGFLHLGATGTITTHATATPPSLLTFTFVATSLLPQALPLPPFGKVWLDPTTVVSLSSGLTTNNIFVSSLPIPNNPALAGMQLYFQALVEGRTPANQPELRLTNVTGETIVP